MIRTWKKPKNCIPVEGEMKDTAQTQNKKPLLAKTAEVLQWYIWISQDPSVMHPVIMQTPPNYITCDCQETLELNNLNFMSALLIHGFLWAIQSSRHLNITYWTCNNAINLPQALMLDAKCGGHMVQNTGSGSAFSSEFGRIIWW